MKPLSRLDISKLTAKKLNLDVEIIDNIVRGYYSFLNSTLANLEHTNINVSGLGTFKVRRNKVQDSIKKQEKIIEMLDYKSKLSLSKYSSLHEAKEKLKKLNAILNQLEEENKNKNNFKNG